MASVVEDWVLNMVLGGFPTKPEFQSNSRFYTEQLSGREDEDFFV